VGSARSGNVGRATLAVQTLGSLRDAATKLNNAYWASQIEVQTREVSAWIAEKKGKTDDALAMMRSAAGLEESMDKDAVTPGAVTPAREMLAELLLLEKEPQDALTEYEAVLKVTPNRFNALFGAATAADTAGNASAANQYFKKLTEIAVGDERSALITARKKLVATSQRPN
jgi:tetratricopeptide (TPR) repeat protein